MVQTSINKLKNFYQNNKFEFILLIIVLLIASFVRLYRIGEYMTFLGDEGRDVIIVRRFLTEGDLFLIGPGTSIGNMYLGPMYYYMMAAPLLLFFFSPIGPAIFIAILGIITVWFVYHVIRDFFPQKGTHFSALAASLLYALAPTVIIYSRSSWNPNIMPFFALLSVYSLWKIVTFKNLKWFLVLGFSFAAVLQSHYLGLLLIPILGLMWIIGLFLHKNNLKPFMLHTTYCILLFLILMSPLVIFDARHGWRNFDAIKTFFTVRQTTVNLKPWKAIPDMWPLMQEITGRVLTGRNVELGNWASVGIVISSLWVFNKARNKLRMRTLVAFSVLIVWLATALIGFGLYKQEIYDHYYGFLFPVYFIFLGGIFYSLSKYAKIRGSWLALTVFFILLTYNLLDNPLRYSPNRQLQRSVEVADKIITESNNQKFNLAVIAERNYEDAYEYFLLKNNSKVTDIDPQNSDETITSQLFVVCELAKEKCDPTHNSKAEVANFGWSQIEEEWEISGVILYKLVHTVSTEN